MKNVILSYTVLGFLHMFCCYIMATPKYSKKRTIILYTVNVLIFVLTVIIVHKIFYYNKITALGISFLFTIVEAFILFVLTSKDLFCKKIFLFVNYSNIFCIYCCASIIICYSLFKGISEQTAGYIKMGILITLYAATIPLYLKYMKETFKEITVSNKKSWRAITGISVLFLFIFSIFTVFCNKYYTNSTYIPIFVVTVLIFLSSLGLIFKIVIYMKNENKMNLIDQNMKYLHKQLEVARINEMNSKKVRHDNRHHILNLLMLLKGGNTEEAISYIEKYNDSLENISPKNFCPNITVNAILSNFYIKSQNKGINVSISSDTAEEIGVSDIDFVAILANVLENAINGCVECNKKDEIKLNIRTIDDKIVIVCSNPCKENIEIVNNMIKKKGIGIESIISAINKYNGDINYELKDGILTVCIILNM